MGSHRFACCFCLLAAEPIPASKRLCGISLIIWFWFLSSFPSTLSPLTWILTKEMVLDYHIPSVYIHKRYLLFLFSVDHQEIVIENWTVGLYEGSYKIMNDETRSQRVNQFFSCVWFDYRFILCHQQCFCGPSFVKPVILHIFLLILVNN